MEDEISKIDSFLPWIFSSSCHDELSRFNYEENIKKNRAPVLVQNLKRMVGQLKEYLEEKCGLTKYDKALKKVEDLCREVENENFTESILREKNKVLSNTEEHVRVTFEWEAISNVLVKAQQLKGNESDCEKSCIKIAIEQLKLAQFEKVCLLNLSHFI